MSAATALSLSGKHRESLELLKGLQRRLSERHGAEDVSVARVHVAIANALGDAKDNEGKVTELEQFAIPMLSAKLGATAKETLLARALLANAYGNLRQAQKQKDILQECCSTWLRRWRRATSRSRGPKATWPTRTDS